MPFDAPVVAAIAKELHQFLPVRIDRVFQPYPDEFLFCGYGSGTDFNLLVSLNAQFGRVHLINTTKAELPAVSSPFCLSLRKHFSGSKLIEFQAVPFERILKLTFEVFAPPAGLLKKHIWLELTGKSANLIITDEQGIIIEAWHKGEPKHPEDREINNNLKYQLPPTGGRWKPVTISLEQAQVIFKQIPAEVPLEKFFLKHWYGLSPITINELTRMAGLTPVTPCGEVSDPGQVALYESLSHWASTVLSGNFQPTSLYDQTGKAIDCSALAIQFPPENTFAKIVPGLNQIVAQVYHERREAAHFQEIKRGLQQKISAQLEKNRKKIAKQENEAAAADRGDQFRIMGELLTANGYKITKGSHEVKLVNHYDPDGGELVISLNPALNAQTNAQGYFKKYQKARKGQQAIAVQIAKTNAVIDYWESVEVLIQSALSVADLRLVREELDQGEAKEKVSPKINKSVKKVAPVEPRQFKTPAGHLILVGRNNLQNDRLTFKIADPTDWWFHTQKIPGSHVILRPQPGVPVDNESLNLACQLAVFFSKGRESTKVPVDYTQRKYVKKPPASKPGFVIYDNFKTAIITPDQGILEPLGITIYKNNQSK